MAGGAAGVYLQRQQRSRPDHAQTEKLSGAGAAYTQALEVKKWWSSGSFALAKAFFAVMPELRKWQLVPAQTTLRHTLISDSLRRFIR